MVAEGDLFWSRRRPNLIMRTLAQTLFKLNLQDRFMPDICLHNDDTLTAYGFHGRIVHVPGHTRGSIGILMEDGAFFCGDLFENRKKPTLNSLMDDPSAARASLEKLRKLNIGFVYPGHGVPFPFAALSGESI